MTDTERLAHHLELLHQYHLTLWNEIEAQLQVLRDAQEQIATLRDARLIDDSRVTALDAARVLSRDVQTLKGRVGTLSSTVAELGDTVSELVGVLSTK